MIKGAFLIPMIWLSLTIETIASQHQLSGSNLTNLIVQRLNKEGLSSQPIIKKGRVFYGCTSDNILIKKRHESWKTVDISCQTNKSWNYTFRTNLTKSIQPEKTEKSVGFSKQSAATKTQNVFVLKHSKKKGDKVGKSDLVLSEKRKILSNGAFDDLQKVLGKRLRKSLRKGAILKANHLNPDWLVYKNQKVTIEHNIGKIYVKMNGIALSNGAKGDRILVKNISSNKTVEGFVKSEKKISIFSKIN